MKLIVYTTQDHFSENGYHYFRNTYGFNPESLPGNFIVFKQDSNPSPVTDCTIIQGWIQSGNKKIPVFRVPTDLSGMGKPLVFFNNHQGRYPCAVETADTIIVSIDIFYHLGLCLSGNFEHVWKNHPDLRCDLITMPFMDYYASFLFDTIRQVHARSHHPFVHKSFWPEGKPCAVCLTHDVDEVKKTYQWVTYPLKLIKKRDFAGLILQFRSFIQKLRGNEPFWTFDEIISVEGTRGVKSSFYFLRETGKIRPFDTKTWRHFGRRYDFNDTRVKELLHDLYSQDWEVGLHGSFYSYLDPEKLRCEKEALEHALGTPVTGGRQHNLNLKIPETWLHQERVGLLYDTTLGYNDCLGFRWGISFPFRPYYSKERRSLNVLQIPLAIEDLPYFRCKEPWNAFLTIFKNVEESHGVLTVLWHHTVFNEHEFPGWGSDYAKIIDYCKKQDAWLASGTQIHAWWTRREKTSIDWVYDGQILKISPSPKEQEHYVKIYVPDSLKIKEVRNATVIRCDQHSCDLKTPILSHEECSEITFSLV
jgi:hypothetical protein